ncbi:MAG: nitroreductase family protein [Anaerolineaceae bacterium]
MRATEGRKEDLRRIYNSDWFVQPPYVAALCLNEERAWKRLADSKSYGMVDAAIAFDHLILMAAELGLGTCWLASFDPEAARQVLSLPDNLTPVLFTPLGYPAAAPLPKRRKSIEELVVWM